MWLVEALLESALTAGVLLLVGYVWAPFEVTWWMAVALVVLAAVYVAVVPAWKYAVHRWEVTGTAVYTQTGWWTRERRIAPISRIQTVDYAEGFLERLFGLARVTVTTASAAGALAITGLERQRAVALSEELTARADTLTGDAT
jgi:membrane protein YdbS with pleckstrin-like domain